ncbi:hypothetical protein ACEU6E_09865 [Halorutilales archaeon Cl-col2-1]
MRDVLLGTRDSLRRKYLLVSLVWFLGVTSVLLLELKTEANLIPDSSLVLVNVVAVVLVVGGATAGFLRAGLVSSWLFTMSPLLSYWTAVFSEGMVRRDPSRVFFVTRGVVWGVVIGVGVGSLSYGLGAGVRKVLRSQSRRGDV